MVSYGNTQVLCVATVDESAPPHLRGKGVGWVTAEYNMLPRSSPERIRRERDKVGGRTHEIQRLVGRALRSVVDMNGWGERSILVDCDVIKADGGTRTASITGAFVALVMAMRKLKGRPKVNPDLAFPVRDFLSAVSVGVVQGVPCLDLDYVEDSTAHTDLNLVVTGSGKIVEIQGTAERDPFSTDDLGAMLKLGLDGCKTLASKQKEILGPLGW